MMIAALAVSSKHSGLPDLYHRTSSCPGPGAQSRNPHRAQESTRRAGGLIEARSGYLPWLSSSGLYDKRQTRADKPSPGRLQRDSKARTEPLHGRSGHQSGGNRAVEHRQANYDLQETISRVTMDVRIAFNELLLNRAKVGVHQNSVRVFEQELKSEQENFNAGIVGKLNVQRAEVALANEQPEFFNAQTDLKNSYLRLAELFGTDLAHRRDSPVRNFGRITISTESSGS